MDAVPVWRFFPSQREVAHRWARRLGVSPIVAQILLNRGLRTPEEGLRFLAADWSGWHDASLLPDMAKAVQRLKEAVRRREAVLVYGDYDVDGTAGGALLATFLHRLGAQPLYYVPHRMEEGYGLHNTGIDAALAEGARLIVTVDCGITAHKEVAYARSQGVEVIITDHHEPHETLPAALAVIDPKRKDSPYPDPHLAGVGVAFKLAVALAREFGIGLEAMAEEFLDLVALGTVADVVPLVGENRLLVKQGLPRLAQSPRTGIQQLLKVCGLEGKPLSTYHIGFIVGPRLNAAGRMDTAQGAFELLTTSDPLRAYELSRYLHRLNYERQQEEGRTLEEALRRMGAECDLSREPGIVLASEEWHIGVIGIVASRLVERFHRPTVLIAVEGEEGKGSARSIPPFPLHEALHQCRDVLLKCGGHAQAAGLSLEARRIGEFRRRFNEVARAWLKEEDLRPVLEIDALVAPRALDGRLYQELEALGPFGPGNPRPVLACRGLRIRHIQPLGPDRKHLRLVVEAEGRLWEGIAWRKAAWAEALREGDWVALAFTLRQDDWHGETRLQLEVKDVRRMEEPCTNPNFLIGSLP